MIHEKFERTIMLDNSKKVILVPLSYVLNNINEVQIGKSSTIRTTKYNSVLESPIGKKINLDYEEVILMSHRVIFDSAICIREIVRAYSTFSAAINLSVLISFLGKLIPNYSIDTVKEELIKYKDVKTMIKSNDNQATYYEAMAKVVNYIASRSMSNRLGLQILMRKIMCQTASYEILNNREYMNDNSAFSIGYCESSDVAGYTLPEIYYVYDDIHETKIPDTIPKIIINSFKINWECAIVDMLTDEECAILALDTYGHKDEDLDTTSVDKLDRWQAELATCSFIKGFNILCTCGTRAGAEVISNLFFEILDKAEEIIDDNNDLECEAVDKCINTLTMYDKNLIKKAFTDENDRLTLRGLLSRLQKVDISKEKRQTRFKNKIELLVPASVHEDDMCVGIRLDELRNKILHGDISTDSLRLIEKNRLLSLIQKQTLLTGSPGDFLITPFSYPLYIFNRHDDLKIFHIEDDSGIWYSHFSIKGFVLGCKLCAIKEVLLDAANIVPENQIN